MTTRRWALLAATPLAAAGFSIGTGGAHATSSAGPPVPTQVLLCGTWSTGSDQFSGTSDIDHPSGSSATGKVYPYHGQNCEAEDGTQPADSSTGTFTWTISHSNVHDAEAGTGPQAEFGTEHGIASLSTDNQQAAGFNGQIKNFDLSSVDNDGDACNSQGSNRSVYYASGNQDTSGSCSPAGPGNFNTHGGASTGTHFRGNYGTAVYQDTDTSDTDSSCNSNTSATLCFEGVINGFTN
jgi:hypothetical protein